MFNENENAQLAVVEPSSLEVMERASIDIQISTAKKYPRTLSTVKAQMLSFATLDQETAAGCFYTLPGRRGGDGKAIQGPSARMAEIALSSFGNMRAGARIIADDGKIITAQGVCHDLQNNVCVSVEVKRRVTTKDGRRYSDDMIVTTGNAACSIALRNATFKVVPMALIKPVYEMAKKTAVGDAKTLVERRANSMAHFAKLGVAKEKVLTVLGVKAVEDIGLEQVEILLGFANAIREGDTTVDEVFNAAPEKSDVAKAGPSAGIVAAAGGTVAPEAKTADPVGTVATAAEPEKKDDIPGLGDAEARQGVIANVVSELVKHGVSEEKLFGYAQRAKLATGTAAHLFDLPTETLAKLIFAIPSQKGGAVK